MSRPVRHPFLAVAWLVPLLSLSCGGRFLCKMPDSEDGRPFRMLGHAATLRLDPANHEVQVTDSLRFSGTLTRFELHAGLELTALEVGGRNVKLKRLVTKESETGGRRIYMLACRMPESGLAVVKARGRLWQDPGNVKFGHETVGNELTATVGEEGAWFAPESAILPVTEDDALVPHRLHADLPADWSLVTDGRLIRDETREGRHLMSWDELLPGGPLSIAAGPYDIRREDVGGVEVSSWFFRRDPAAGPFQGMSGPVDDEQVRGTLHRMSAYYLEMYRELLGPYPYSKFAVVESFFPSGYGMPGWTLLGSQVIRMPYIPYTSLGHELLHNYWGNGVYVDVSRGNWCEGITVYDADYRYKRLESPEAGREYRKGILKDYRSYVDGSRDLPLREFVNRHDGATRSIGYGKSMMVFHMLEQLLGRETFDQVRRGFYQAWTGREASWDDLLEACEAAGQLDLSTFAAQWLDQTGAPVLELGEVDYEGGRLRGVLKQTQTPPYDLDVPIRVEAHDGSVLVQRVRLDGPETHLEIVCPLPRKVQVDPDYDLFRLLDGREMEPVVSLVLGEPNPLFAAPRAWLDDPARREALDAFAKSLREVDTPEWVACEEFHPEALATRSAIFVNPPRVPAGLEFLDLRMTDSRWEIAGTTGERAERSLVLAGKAAANDRKGALLVFVPGVEALPALARKVPHYGKYSYLAFDAAGVNVAKGNLSPAASPLERRFGGW
jgi:aminopeptidase N